MNKGQKNNSSQRILVADDDADILRINVSVLVAAGYQVDTAEDGAVAWAAVQRNSYDLLITDNNMPHLSGVELIENLFHAHLELPVILVSGNVPTEELNRCPWLQIEATLLKPYTIADFLGTVEAVLRRGQRNFGAEINRTCATFTTPTISCLGTDIRYMGRRLGGGT